ncbi:MULTISPECIES: class I SAM-dependent methyltransferase [Lysobacter]|uniref:class I SAM-dependent methyltransferase n=1 Tax=Lysobacter TaxID=68 RepID=UPI001F2D6C11|nr:MULTISPECIES: methyltransferase domain-containing protein [Lysobacter]UJB17342.1 class I SAM-dependent methyltransferase [Lysobacter capsici]UJQ28935.1 class I SAM-dependent methyltransferase [Lysobacter gummosus]
MTDPDNANNRRTVAAYEDYARSYAQAVSATPSAGEAEGLRRLAAAVPACGRVLDIGSGPGWEADFLETLGLQVRRTDVTESFLQFQIERGKSAYRFDVLSDEIADTYDGMLMLYVLQHFERGQLDGVLRKLARGLTANGALLLSHFLGEGETWEGDAQDYRFVRWSSQALDECLAQAGFTVEWENFDESANEERPWRRVLARKHG